MFHGRSGDEKRKTVVPIGGVTAFSTLDCPGDIAAVFYFQGCPFRCPYCHNPEFQKSRASGFSWEELDSFLSRRQGFLEQPFGQMRYQGFQKPGPLGRLAERLGGTEWYLPVKLAPTHPITRVVGIENAAELARVMNGARLDIPLCAALRRARRNEQIYQLWDDGQSTREIAMAIGVSQRWVRYILAQRSEQSGSTAAYPINGKSAESSA